MFCLADETGYTEMADGIEMKTLVHGRNTLMARYRMKKGSLLPAHEHPHEQTGILISGRIRLKIGDEISEVGPGDSWNIAGNQTHGAEILEDAVAIEVFSPVRRDFLS